jgi:hypothetical protein
MSQVPSPSFHLALLTVDKLVKAGLLRADRREAVVNRISAGNMTSEDWKAEIEFAVAKVQQS